MIHIHNYDIEKQNLCLFMFILGQHRLFIANKFSDAGEALVGPEVEAFYSPGALYVIVSQY